MISRPRSRWQAALAIVAALAMLMVSSASVIPGRWHDSPQCSNCDICRSGHLPMLELAVPSVLESPAPVEWRGHAVERLPVFEPVFIPSSPRAPPA
ncbi:MAG TPA: hypothetical protein VEU62_05990 [Bryobacterales bacterium]|nr:hypothetical protein [Bryobacterales bacterium]